MNKIIKSPVSDCPRFYSFYFFALVLLFCCSSQAIFAQTRLELNKPAERELKGGETHSYTVALEANQFLHLAVDQRGIDIVVTLYAPDNKKIVQVDSPNGTQGIEPLSYVASSPGTYRVEVKSPEAAASGGSYEIVLEELRPSNEQDSQRLNAEKLYADGVNLLLRETAESLKKSVENFESALKVFRALNLSRQQADALTSLGLALSDLSQYKEAIADFEQSAALYKSAGGDISRGGEATALEGLGLAYLNTGDRARAKEIYEQALPLARSVKYRATEGRTLNGIGQSFYNGGERQKALDYYKQALPVFRALGDKLMQAAILNNIAGVYSNLGEKQQAIEAYREALVLARATNGISGQAAITANLGALYNDLGDQQKALEYLDESLPLRRQAGDKNGEAATLNTIGVVYVDSGEYLKALEFYNQALSLNRALSNRRAEANSLMNIGRDYSKLGDDTKALDYLNQALPLLRDVGDRGREALAFGFIGAVYTNQKRFADAENFYNQALKIHQELVNPRQEAAMLYNLASLYRDDGKIIQARSRIEAALKIVETIRAKISSPNLRAVFLAEVQNYYELYIDVLMRLQKEHPSEDLKALSLEVSERARARSFLELLVEAKADFKQSVDADLLGRESETRDTLAARADAQTRLLSGRHTIEQAAAVAREVSELTDRYEQIEAEMRDKSPRYAALTQPEPVTLQTVQSELLDKNTVLLEYSLGAERSFLWTVTPDSIKSYELPKRADIEAQAREFYGLLTARNENERNETDEQKRQRIVQADAKIAESAARLSETILAPAVAELKSKRLLIVADGALQYVPFAALQIESSRFKVQSPKTEAEKSKPENRFLIETNEIVNLPSVSVLSVLRGETAGRKSAPRELAVFADPVFSLTDARLTTAQNKMHSVSTPDETIGSRNVANPASKSTGSNAPMPDVARAFGDINNNENGLQIPRLPFSRREAQSILALAPNNQELSALDFKANLETALSPQLAQYRIVHFATHGLLDSVHPELSGIVLSLVDASGKPQDGFLRLNEIYNLKLPADLIVLSACQTALGKDIKGEGLIGLTRGFMYAGAPRVVASLWKVDDAATAELMRLFYEKMLKENVRPAAALRAAQSELAQQKRFASPYFWAAFTLQGEWK